MFASACVAVFLLALWLAGKAQPGVELRASSQGRIEWTPRADGSTPPRASTTLVGIVGADGKLIALDALALSRSPRWLVDDAARERHRSLHAQLAEALGRPGLGLRFADGSTLELTMQRRGFGGLGVPFWLLSGLAALLYVGALAVLMARSSPRNMLFGVMSMCQVANLLVIAVASAPDLGLPGIAVELPLRLGLDLVTAAAALHAASLYFRGSPAVARNARVVTWALAALLIIGVATGRLDHAWWWAQAAVALACIAATVLLSWPWRGPPYPQALQLRRLAIAALGTWALLTFALASSNPGHGLPQHPLAETAATVWYVFLATLLLLVPVLARAQRFVRELALLAALGTVAISLDLIFAGVLGLGQFAALTLSLCIALALYAAAREWILTQLLGSSRFTTERMFEQLYRIAREVQAHPALVPPLLLKLLRDLFDPVQAELVEGGAPAAAQVEEEGSTLVVPVPMLAPPDDDTPAAAIRLRFAQRGRRTFMAEDARLTDAIVEQLRRAVAFDHAVEQGRREERLRLAQDLHDDIGARLLTLMYKAQSPEIEEYVRHTLKDLKTLTRGLAASNHRLSHAAAEWKADLSQRLTAADIHCGWGFSADRELELSVVQWSALTRILRELVSNAIAHANARRVQILLQLEGHRLELSVADDGEGRDPAGWSHGLGLGGVRKRVKQLGGEVDWRQAGPHGTECRVRVTLGAHRD